jgi:hypothetical protein
MQRWAACPGHRSAASPGEHGGHNRPQPECASEGRIPPPAAAPNPPTAPVRVPRRLGNRRLRKRNAVSRACDAEWTSRSARGKPASAGAPHRRSDRPTQRATHRRPAHHPRPHRARLLPPRGPRLLPHHLLRQRHRAPELLIASHIVPWSTLDDRAPLAPVPRGVGLGVRGRVDPRNGLCLSRLHDAAFDRGLITFDASWPSRSAR